jgi:hypothetical protein
MVPGTENAEFSDSKHDGDDYCEDKGELDSVERYGQYGNGCPRRAIRLCFGSSTFYSIISCI